MTVFLDGWLGYGAGLQADSLAEPADPDYARQPFRLGDIDSGIVCNVTSGTVGPAGVAWGSMTCAGVYDAASGGNLLFWFYLRHQADVQVGQTLTVPPGYYHLRFHDLQAGLQRVVSWPAGCVIGALADGRPLFSGVALQVSDGTLTAQVSRFGTNVSMASLPSVAGATGSGLLWNNGGVISVS